jgi:Sulfotransferase domain
LLPTFIVIGAMKSGTTSLASYLSTHPDVFVTDPKEPRYFTQQWDKGQDWYEALFDGAGPATARGEASTDYSKAPQVPSPAGRIAALVPDVRLVYLVREPVDRIRSQYVHRAARFNETKIERRPLDETVRSKPIYLDWSRYGAQLEPYLEHFDRTQILLMTSERLRHDRAAALADVFTFIGVDPTIPVPNLHEERNRGAEKRRMPRWVRPARKVLWKAGIYGRLSPEQRVRVQRFLQREDIEAVVTPEIERWILAELAEDLQRLRAIAGPDLDLWGHA